MLTLKHKWPKSASVIQCYCDLWARATSFTSEWIGVGGFLEQPELDASGLLLIHKHLRLFRLTNQANVHFSVRGRKEHLYRTHAAAAEQSCYVLNANLP